jgi:hypothetical protein
MHIGSLSYPNEVGTFLAYESLYSPHCIIGSQLTHVSYGILPQWSFFFTAFTVPCAAVFVFVELFRETSSTTEKSEWETILEGVVLFLLVCLWIPAVIVATTPGGIASLVGNAYFFTWASTVFVMETSVWWIHDWRKRVHAILEEQEEDYRKIQRKVLEQSRMNMEEGDEGNQSARSEELVAEGDRVAQHVADDDSSSDADYEDTGIPDVVGN